MRGIIVFLFITAIASGAEAQTSDMRGSVAAVAGVGRTWDDEGSIGNGAAAGGRVEWRLFGNTSIEGAIETLAHDRRGGFFQSEGRSNLFSVSLLHRFGSPGIQPYVLEGVGLVRHSGTTRVDDLATQRTSTDTAFHFGAGLAVRIGERVEIGPEARFYVIRPSNGSDPAWANWIGARLGVRF